MKLPHHQQHEEKGKSNRKGWTGRSYKFLLHNKDCARCAAERDIAASRRKD